MFTTHPRGAVIDHLPPDRGVSCSSEVAMTKRSVFWMLPLLMITLGACAEDAEDTSTADPPEEQVDMGPPAPESADGCSQTEWFASTSPAACLACPAMPPTCGAVVTATRQGRLDGDFVFELAPGTLEITSARVTGEITSLVCTGEGIPGGGMGGNCVQEKQPFSEELAVEGDRLTGTVPFYNGGIEQLSMTDACGQTYTLDFADPGERTQEASPLDCSET